MKMGFRSSVRRLRSLTRHRPECEALEPRILYSADVAALAAGAGGLAAAPAPGTPAVHAASLEAVAQTPLQSQITTKADPAAPALAQPAQSGGRELVVVDSRVQGLDGLLADLGNQAQAGRPIQVLVLQSGEDAISAISRALADAGGDVSALHLIGHGEAGEMTLGNSQLDAATLRLRAGEIAQWSGSLTATADLLLYGCDFAANAAGQSVVQSLAQLTGADVAASIDTTGSAALGGNWTLEYSTGPIEAQVAPSAAEQAAFQGQLAGPNNAPTIAPWYNPAWTYRQPISIDHTKVSGGADLTDFPVLINLSADANLAAGAQASGNDIVFTSADGTTKLSHEIETFTSASGALMAWVKVPVLSASVDTMLFIYFGNAAAPGQQNAAGVWDASSAAVYHLGQSTSPYLDSTGNANNGAGGTSPGAIAGEIGSGQSFDGSTTSIVVADSATLDPGLNATVSAWVRLNATGQADLVEKGGFGGYTLWLNNNVIWFGSQNSAVNAFAVGSTPLNTGVWYEVVGVNDNGIKSLYINGVLDATSTASDAFSNAGALQIGNGFDGHLNGTVDEVRVENTARSAGWITTRYNNESSPAAFASVGALQSTNEDTASSGTTVSTILGWSLWADADAGAAKGIAITAVAGNGNWQYSTDGLTWTGFGSVSASSALLLTSTSQVRYVPDGMNGETATFGFRAWDQTTGTASVNGTPGYANPGAGGGATAYSSQVSSLSLAVSSVNDAPVLSGATALGSINENPVTNAGTLVSALIAGHVTDVDAGAMSGIAVTAIDNSNGAWEYSTNGGATWAALGSPTSASARLLAADASTYVRFVPNTGFSGAISNGITFRAWDQTSGLAGGVADTALSGGVFAFSSATAAAGITVNPTGVISGNIYEDVNGDSNLADAVGLDNVTVRLYRDNGDGTPGTGDVLVGTTDTTSGAYSFTGLSNATYWVAVDSRTIVASSGMNAGFGSGDTWAEQTYGSAGSVGFSGGYTFSAAAGSFYGGMRASVSDAATALATSEHVTRAVISGSAVSGVDSAFSFNVVTNTQGGDTADDDPGANRTVQGSLRQFIENADAIAGANTMRFVPVEAANAASGADSWWHISISNALPTITDAGTTIDGLAYSAADGVSVRNTNTGQLGAGGTVGTNAVGLGRVERPELEIQADRTVAPSQIVAAGLDINANGAVIRDIAIFGFGRGLFNNAFADIDVHSGASGTLIEDNVIGAGAASFSDPGAASRTDGAGILFDGSVNGTVRNNLIGFATGQGIWGYNTASGWTITGNEVRGNEQGSVYFIAGIDIDAGANFTISQNLITGQNGPGINLNGTAASDTIADNTIDANGLGVPGNFTAGIRLGGGTGGLIQSNVISANVGAGVLVASGVTGVTISRNSIYGNGAVNGQIGIDLLSAADSQARGTAPYVTLNDAGDGDAGGNNLQNFPVLETARLVGGNLIITGWARPGTVIELFLADGTGGFGEGKTYLATFTEGSGADTDAGVSSYGPGPINGVVQGSDSTNRFTFTIAAPVGVSSGVFVTATGTSPSGNTSEFSACLMVNSAPVLSGANNLGSINEDPSSNPGTLVSALIAGQVSDADAGALTGIVVTAVDTSNGAWEYSLNGGGTWLALGSPTAGSARLLAADGSTYVRFVPNANFNGTVAAGITFRAWDQTTGTAGGLVDTTPGVGGSTAFSSATASAGITVVSVNDAPLGTSKTVSTLEDTAYVFTVADFGFSDANDAPANALLGVTISAVPGAGSLTDNGVAVGAGQFVSLADIAGGKLVFAPAADANGAGYASFGFQVKDDGGTANGGVDTDPVARTMTIDVTPVNDAPVLTPVAPVLAPLSEDQTANAGQSVASIVGGSISDADAASPQGIAIIGLSAGNGTWQYSITGGASWVAIGAVSNNSALLLRSGDLVRFVPDGSNGTSASIDYRAWDQSSGVAGGLANAAVNGGATAFSTATDTAGITVSSVNDAPVLGGANNPAAINEDAVANAGTLVSALIAGQVSDVDTGAVTGIAVTAVDNSHGAWQFSTDGGTSWSAFGAVSAASARLLAADAATYVRFVPDPDWNGTVAGGITLRAWDQTSGVAGSTADTTAGVGGTSAFSSATASASLIVQSVNDAPLGTDKTVSTLEDTPYVFTTADFGFSDPHDAPANALLGVTITMIPSAGTLTDNGVAVGAGQLVSVADIAGGRLVFTPALNANGTGYASFAFQVQDDGGTANGGANLDPAPRTMTIDVTGVNDAPLGTSKTVSTLEDTAYVFTTADFGFSDPNDLPGNSLLNVSIASLPSAGTLTDNGVAVIAGQVVSVADIAGGKLVFTPVPDANGAGYASFTFRVQDDGGTANGGVDQDAVARTITIDVTAVNDAPVLTPAAPALPGLTEDQVANAGQSVASIIGGSVADADAGALQGIAITALNPGNGAWQYSITGGASWVAVGPVSNASALLLRATDLLRFVPDGNNGTTASIDYRAWDRTTGAAGALADASSNGATSAFSTSTDSASITVSPVNDAPVLAGANNLAPILEDASTNPGTLVSALIAGQSSDVDTGALAGIAVTAVDNSNGSWQYSTDGGSSWSALAGVNAGSARLLAADASTYVRFVPNPDWNGTVTNGITFYAWDQSSGAAGGIADTTAGVGGTSAFSSATASASIPVVTVNDAPAGTDHTVATNEDTPYVFTVTDFGFSDAHDAPANALLGVTIAALPATGSLTDNGVAVGAGQFIAAADIASGWLAYTPAADANGNGLASFQFQVRDDGGTANGGIDADPTVRTMTIDVAPVNDAPGITAPATLVVIGNAASPVTGIVFADVDAGAGIVTASFDVPRGQLAATSAGGVTIGGSALSLTMSGTIANLNAFIAGGSLTYTTAAFDPNPVTLTVAINDLGNTGAGGPLTAGPVSVAMNVNVVNQPPANLLPAPLATAEDTTLAVTGLSVVDGESNLTTVQLAVGSGVMSVDLSGGAVLSAGANGSAGLTLSGNQSQINAALASLTYRGNPDFNGADALSITSTDGWGASSASSLAIAVSPVNDAPTATIAAVGYTVLEQTTLALQGTGLSIADVDAGNGTVTAQLVVGEGVLNVYAGATGVTVSGSGTAAVTLAGTVAQINALLAGASAASVLFYNGSDAPSAVTALALTVNDGGNTGGGALSASASVPIVQTPVNDPPSALTFNASGTLPTPSAAGTLAGTLAVTDPDNTTGFTFTLTDSASGRFAIDPVTGAIRVAAPGMAGVPVAQEYTIVVRVADAAGAFIERSFAVSVSPEVLGPASGGGFGPGLPPPGPTDRLGEFQDDSGPITSTGSGSGSSAGQGTRLQMPTPPTGKGLRTRGVGQTDSMADAVNASGWMHVSPESIKNGLTVEVEYRLPDDEVRKRTLDSKMLFELLRDRLPLRSSRSAGDDWYDRYGAAPTIQPIAWQELEQNAEVAVYRTVIETIQVGGVLMSVGIVLWLARAGGLLAAMLTSMPAWKALDPLVLLAPQAERGRLWASAPDTEHPEDTELSEEEAAVAEVLGDARATRIDGPGSNR